jgi:hypothetical protein
MNKTVCVKLHVMSTIKITTMNGLAGILAATLVPAERVAAENALQQASRNPSIAVGFASLLVDETAPTHIRQLAGVLLKQFVGKHWTGEAQ